MKSIKKSEFINLYILPHIRPYDKPHNRSLWCEMGDSLIKAGIVTEKRFNQWAKTPKKYFGDN